MQALVCIKTRRSVRSFTEQPVSRELLTDIIEAASFAPSWKNTQTARYVVIEDRELINRLADDCVLGFEHNAKIMKNSAAVILLTCVKGRSGCERDGSFTTSKGDRWEMFDAGVAAQTFCLAAHEKGLGTVIMGIFDEDKVIETAEIPEGQSVSAIIAIGHPAVSPEAPKRKDVSELITFK